jgi:WD40 repeat protein
MDALVWRATGGKPTHLAHTDNVFTLTFSPNSRLLATAASRTVRLWDVQTFQCLHRFRAFVRTVGCLAFSPDGRLLAAGNGESRVRLWETATGRELADLQWQIGVIGGLSFAPDGATAAVAGSRKKLLVWDVDL